MTPDALSQRARAALAALTLLASVFVASTALAAGGTGDAEGSTALERKTARAAAKPLYDGKWKRNVSAENKRWARRVAACESGGDPNALGAGGRYRGAFQFHRSTWKQAPRSPGGDPIRFSFKTQAFVAVRLKERDGKGHWPNCP